MKFTHLFKLIFVLLLFHGLCLTGHAQSSRHIIQLADKGSNTFSLSNPGAYLSPKALQRRLTNQIVIDSTDLPVTARYLDSIRLAGAVTILNTSKWLNQVAIQTTDAAALAKISAFPFVKKTSPVAAVRAGLRNERNKFDLQKSNSADNIVSSTTTDPLLPSYSYGKANGQVKIHQGAFLHDLGFRGDGMEIAVLDAGFYHYLSLPTFDSVRINKKVLGTWDFVDNHPGVDEDHWHGMWCLSTMAANMPGTFVGTAPKAGFYLFRTEDAATEYPIEEHFYAAGLEKADSLGVAISSTSLGYYDFQGDYPDYSYGDMNGNTTVSARAADIAASKGMLLLVAAGNEGARPWKYLITPGDADSVLAVGAVDSLGNVGSFSSYGPSADGQVKPGVAAVGWNAAAANTSTGLPEFLNGTSLACPNMAGLATCLWQAFPEQNNMGIISALQESAHRFTSPDNRVGYGIPDMKKAFVILLKRLYQQQVKQSGCNTEIKWTVKSNADMLVEVQRRLAGDTGYRTIFTQPGQTLFSSNPYSYNDDLSGLPTAAISYRLKMTIATDTAFYFDPVTINHTNACFTYRFVGNGNWSLAANWLNGNKPPAILPAGGTIIVDPEASGECILDVPQQIMAGAILTVMPGKKFRLPGNLLLE